jgi:hypothetical protein
MTIRLVVRLYIAGRLDSEERFDNGTILREL